MTTTTCLIGHLVSTFSAAEERAEGLGGEVPPDPDEHAAARLRTVAPEERRNSLRLMIGRSGVTVWWFRSVAG
jgi:hypothetical protein